MDVDPAETYRLLTRHFLSVFELPPERRKAVLHSAPIPPDLLAQVENLLAIHDEISGNGTRFDSRMN